MRRLTELEAADSWFCVGAGGGGVAAELFQEPYLRESSQGRRGLSFPSQTAPRSGAACTDRISAVCSKLLLVFGRRVQNEEERSNSWINSC